jgi:hypothetical protein
VAARSHATRRATFGDGLPKDPWRQLVGAY